MCTSCECELPLSAFNKHKTGGQGVAAECKECRAIIRAEADRSAEYAKRARDLFDPAKDRKRRMIAKITKSRRRANKEKMLVCRSIDQYLKTWYSRRDKPWTRPGLTGSEVWALRYSLDEEFILRERTKRRLRRKGLNFDALWRMRQALNGQVGDVGLCTLEGALGYSMSDLKAHLEGLFTDGMSWDAFRSGDIHIDHKRPLASFDLDDPAQVLGAWSLDNLQPLWAKDNLSKGAKSNDEWLASKSTIDKAA